MEQSIQNMLREFAWNPWFINTFWPENERRVRMILADIEQNVKPGDAVLDVGCFNGFLSVLLANSGYKVTATDSADIEERDGLFARYGIEFFPSNLNELSALDHISDNTFSAVVMGEVIEHILNHPLGLMQSVARVLKPGGILILTTPNPATLANAYRTLRGTASLWGTPQFMDLPKVEHGKVIDIGDVHYREYPLREIEYLLGESGFAVEKSAYFAFGSSSEQSVWKRVIKTNPLTRSLMSFRLFGANLYVIARRISYPPL